ncbi:hypothetical protein FQR65_LT02458 [Abscondita terminalis]|nr:hypothetical protein FQR65_LT02458 [Abscondita terminalis]
MNTLLVVFIIAAASAVNAALIPAPAVLSGMTFKGPASRSTMFGPDGSRIDAADDAGAVSSSMVSPAIGHAMYTSPIMYTANGLMTAKTFMPGYLGLGLNSLDHPLMW